MKQSDEGTLPESSSLSKNQRFSNLVKFANVDGIVPVSSFSEKDKKVSRVNEDIEDGMVPCRALR